MILEATRKTASLAAMVVVVALGSGCNENTLASSPAGSDRPVAEIEGQSEYSPLDTAAFDGTGSYDPDGGEIVEYAWEMLERPSGSNAEILSTGADGGTVDFFVDFAGDYTIQLTVTDDEGDTGSTTFDFSATPWQAIHVELAWDIDTVDVDLHLVDETAGGTFYQAPYDCYYANTQPNWGASGAADDPRLDIDDVDGYGPENINLNVPIDGHIYHVYVHYFSDDMLGSTNSTVRIYLSGELQFEQVMLLQQTGKVWDVAKISWPDGAIDEVGTIFDNGSPW